jgi:peptidoglycan/LPS O-acetylase OafA/YrhL
MNADKWIEKHRSKIVLLGIIWFVSLVIMMIDNKYTKTFYSSIKPSVMLYSITTFIFFYTVARLFRQCKWKVWKIPEWISVQSYNIYLSHLFVLNLIKLYIENHGSGVFWQRTRGMAVLYIMTVLFTFAFVYVISLIPFAGLLGGARIRLGSRYHEANKV